LDNADEAEALTFPVPLQ